MILQTIQRKHRKFELMHEIEALHDFVTENATPDGVEIEIDFQHKNFHYVVRIDAIQFLSITEYQFRLGTFNRCVGFVDSILIDCESFDEFFAHLWNIL